MKKLLVAGIAAAPFCVLFVALVFGCATPAFASENDSTPDKSLTCNVYDGSFVLNESDFAALNRPSLKPKDKITLAYFASLKRDSELRSQICDTRKLLRLIKAGKATNDDFNRHYPKWIADFWSEEEVNVVLKYQIEMAVKNSPNPQGK
jgi:hypothetical protein